MMNNIDQLLEKYWNAETSLKEESEIRAYFKSDNVDSKHEAFRPMFDYFGEKIEEGIDLDIAKLIESSEKGSAVTDFDPVPNEGARVINFRKMITAIAAIFVLGFAAYSIMQFDQPEEYQYKGKFVTLEEEKDAEEALEITKQALALLSKKVNKGAETTVNSVAQMEKANIFKLD